MKKFKIIAYFISIIIIVVLLVTIYSSIAKSEEVDEKDKTVSEIKFLEEKMIYIANMINNIENGNYNIKVGKLQTSDEEKSTNSLSEQNSESEKSNQSQDENSTKFKNSTQTEDSSKSEKSSSQTPSEESENAQNNKKYELQFNGILSKNDEENWNIIKSEIEMIYISIPTITMDLYKTNINQEEILKFNKEYDNLTIVAKYEKKEETLAQIAKLYSYISIFMNNTKESNFIKKTVETKSYVLTAYSNLEKENWSEIRNNIKKAIETYSTLLSDTENNKQNVISKCYIMLNELQNAINIKDREVFLIKYKNLIQEMLLL